MSFHVIVVGGGIGGLCLAQGLRKAGVSVAVYEKGERHPPSSWQQGYQIHINAAGSTALEECLPPSTKALFTAKALRPSAGVQALTEHLEPIGGMAPGGMPPGAMPPGNVPPGPIRGSNPIVRSTLREVLLMGLDDVVHFTTPFDRFERADGGRIRAVFDDGTAALGDVLVGADGIGSKVRAQYLPYAEVTDTGLVGMAGKLPITDQMRSYLPEHLLTHLTSIRASKGLYMIVTHSIHKRDNWSGETGRSGAASPSLADPASDEADHSIWVLISSRATYGSQPRSLFHDGPALQQLALRQMDDWHPSLRRMVMETDPAVISATALQGAEPVTPWETTNVTLLGDAIHTMPPVLGLGGSTALRDAALLCRTLEQVERGDLPLIPAIHAYEAAMLEYGFEAVRASMQMARMITSDSPQSMDFLRQRFTSEARRSPTARP
jgi:2-polyprenyl-6-methoxyphenol hydroxylase-like FAD-dependent oxidoreductase